MCDVTRAITKPIICSVHYIHISPLHTPRKGEEGATTTTVTPATRRFGEEPHRARVGRIEQSMLSVNESVHVYTRTDVPGAQSGKAGCLLNNGSGPAGLALAKGAPSVLTPGAAAEGSRGHAEEQRSAAQRSAPFASY